MNSSIGPPLLPSRLLSPVEVDASDVGVVGILPQHSAAHYKLRPCTFFSCQLSAERNYDIGNRELLVLKQWSGGIGWRGADHPFRVWTDQKNLKYIPYSKEMKLSTS